jgi:antirestriction protein ArdC/DNA polymerase III epsilon subunit-like protein
VSNFIEEFDRNNTPDESLKDSIIDIIESALVDAPKGRTVSDEAVFTVAERALVASASLEIDVQCFNALREVQNFLTLALEGPSANGEMSHTDLLPLGHPSSTAQHDLPAATLRTLTANWVASDPRIKSDEARAIVAAVYASNPYSVDYAFNMVRLQALAADQVPVELTLQPLVAFGNPYAGKNSSWHRRMRANRQRRDDEGQFAEMGGGIRFYVRKGSNIYSIVGKVAGIPENDPNGIDIEVTNVKGFKNGIYTVPSEITHTFKAILPEHSVSNLVPMAKNSNVPFVDIKDLKRKDLPTSWYPTKVAATVSGLTSKVKPNRNFVTGDGYQASLYNKPDEALQKRIAEAQQKFGAKIIGQFGTDQLNPDKPVYELISSKRGQEEVVGYAQDWASTQQLATQEDRNYPDTENEPTSGTPVAELPEPQEEPEVEDTPEEPYVPVDPDVDVPEDWGKVIDNHYQSKDGNNYVTFGPATVSVVPVYNFDDINGQDILFYEPSIAEDAFTVYDLTASATHMEPIGIGFSWSDVKDIIASVNNQLPTVSWDAEGMDSVRPPFMRFTPSDDVAFEDLKAKVKEDAQYYRDRLEKAGNSPDDSPVSYVSPYKNDTKHKLSRQITGPTHQAFDRSIINDPSIGRLIDDMYLNPENYTLAEAAALADIINSTQPQNPERSPDGKYPKYIGKAAPGRRQIVLAQLAKRTPPAGQEGLAKEIFDSLYNLPGAEVEQIIKDINASWGWGRRAEDKITAQEVADKKGQFEPVPQFLESDVDAARRPTPSQIVKVESILVNRKLQDLIDEGDDQDKNYPNFQEEFRTMTSAALESWINEGDEAPYKDKYQPQDPLTYYTNLGKDGANPRQLSSIERVVNTPGLLSEKEIAEILSKLPDLTAREASENLIESLRPREISYWQTALDYRTINSMPIDDILDKIPESIRGSIAVPENYVPTRKLEDGPIQNAAPATPTPTAEPAPTPVADQPAPEDSTEEPEAESPLNVDYVNPGILKVGNRVVVNGVPKVISYIGELDGFYAVLFEDGTSETYNQADDVPVFYGPVPKPFEPDLIDDREQIASNDLSIFYGTPYHTVFPIEAIVGDKKLLLPDNIGGNVVQAILFGYPIDRMQLPDWYKNQDAIEAAVRRAFQDDNFTLESYTPRPEKVGQEDWLVNAFDAYVAFTKVDIDGGEDYLRARKYVEAIYGLILPYDTWANNKQAYERLMSPVGQGRPVAVQEENLDEDVRILEDARVATILKSGLQIDLGIIRAILDETHAMLADALRERAVTAQGRKIIQGAITDISTLKPKMTLRNKNLPTPEDVNEVLARVRDGLLDAGEVETYGRLNRPSKALLEILTELSAEVNKAIGIYKAGAITTRAQLMSFKDSNPEPKMTRFDPPAFVGPALDEVKNIDNYQDLVDFLYSKDIYVFDFETTGIFKPADPEIKNDPIQMAIVKISNGKIDSQMSTYINPGSKISSWVLSNVGNGQGGRVNSDFLSTQPSKKEAMRTFLENIPEGSILAGHNGFLFDIEVLNRTLTEAGLPEFKYGGFIDTLGLARYIMPKWSHTNPDAPFFIDDSGIQRSSQTLEALVNYFGLSNNGRHEADSDVVSTYEVLKNILQRGLDGRAKNGPNFDYEASTNGWNKDEYDFHAADYKARVANYIAKRTVELFTTQEAGDGSVEAEVLVKNAAGIINGIAASQSQEENRPQFMAFPPTEPKIPTKAEQKAAVKKIDEFDLDVSYVEPKPTKQGLRIIKAAILNMNLVVQAYAGAGKTTMMRGVALAKQMKDTIEKTVTHGSYFVFNKHNQLEADRVMPGNMESRTFGSMAYNAAVNNKMTQRMQVDEYNLKKKKQEGVSEELDSIWRTSYPAVRDMFGFTEITLSNGVKMSALEATQLAVGALDAWILTADKEISTEHFFDKNNQSPFDYNQYQDPKQLQNNGVPDETIFTPKLIRMAKMLWAELTAEYKPGVEQLLVNHDDLIKNFQLTEPDLSISDKNPENNKYTVNGLLKAPKFILIDEAQDMNPAIFDIFQKQKTKYDNGIQIIIVGDTFQQIYEFRGTVDALGEMGRDVTLPLSQSYRFGPAVAALANKVLSFLGVKTDIIGNPDLDTQILDDNIRTMSYTDKKIDVVIARKNLGVLTAGSDLVKSYPWLKFASLLEYRQRYRDVFETIMYLLYPDRGRPSRIYRPLSKFKTWQQVEIAAQEFEDKEAKEVIALRRSLAKNAGVKGPDRLLEEIVSSLRAVVDGFSVPEKDSKTGNIPSSGDIGNNLKYEVVGDNLRISDSGKWVPYSRIPIHGTKHNKYTLKGEGYVGTRKSVGKNVVTGKEKFEFYYDKPIEGKDKAASVTKMIEDLVGALSGSDADIFVTNAHGAKGLEYDNVVIWDDFETPEKHASRVADAEAEGKDTSKMEPEWKKDEEIRLAYVALTRAKKTLYTGGLSFYLTTDPEKQAKKDEQKPSNRPDVDKITRDYANPIDVLKGNKKFLEEQLDLAEMLKNDEQAAEIKKSIKDVSAQIKKEKAKLTKEERAKLEEEEKAEAEIKALEEKLAEAEQSKRAKERKAEIAEYKKNLKKAEEARKKSIAEAPARRAQARKDRIADIESYLPELYAERGELEDKIADPDWVGNKEDLKNRMLAGLNRFIARYEEELNDLLTNEEKYAEEDLKERDEFLGKKNNPQLMRFEGKPGEFSYPAYNEQMIANIEKSIDEAKEQLSRKPADREVTNLPDEDLERQISSLEQQIADIQADPDYFRKIDQSNLATAKEALQQLLSGNLDPKLLTYAERWALRYKDGSLGGPAGKNRSMILGLRAKIEELSLRLGESDGTQTANLMLMAFDAADNIDDNQAVTPKPGEPGSDENPIQVDLTEEIKSTNKSNQEVVNTVVASILEAMEKGIIPWKKPWTGEGGFLPTSGATGRVYRGLNLLSLLAASMVRDYKGTRWYTKNAISKLGGYVNKGEDDKDPGVIITFVSTKKYDKEEQVQVPDPDNPDKTKTETRTVTKKFAKMGLDIVYNEDEIQGVELPKLVRKDPPAISEVENIVLDSYTDKPPIQYVAQDSAYWSPSEDVIRLPLREQFNSTEEHLDTLFHELTHSTGHQNRLDRKDLLENYGTHKDVRAREELIAEIGSAILAQMMNVDTSIDNVAAYVQSWATWLKGDPNALHEAASLASKAVEHILGGYWASVDGMVDLNEETEAKTVEAIDMPQGEITGEDGTSGGLGKGVNYRIEGESVILMGNTTANKEIIKATGITPEGKKRPFTFIFHGRNKYWFVTLSGETGLGDRMRILAELKKNLDGDATVTPG